MTQRAFMMFGFFWVTLFFLDALTAQGFSGQDSVLNDIVNIDLSESKDFVIVSLPLHILSFFPAAMGAMTADFWFFTGAMAWVRWFIVLVLMMGFIWGMITVIGPLLVGLITGLGQMVRNLNPFGS